MDDLSPFHAKLVAQAVAAIAGRLPSHVSRSDLAGWGTLGLMDAIRRFDPKRSSFKAFASYRIRGAILDGLRGEDPVSRCDRKEFRRVQTTIMRLAHTLGREPEEDETAYALGIPLREWQQLRTRFGRTGQIRTAGSQSVTDIDRLPGMSVDPFEATLSAERRSLLDGAIATLPRRYQLVLVLYYRRDFTLKEIGVRLGVNQSRVSQMHRAALGRITQYLRERFVSSGLNGKGNSC